MVINLTLDNLNVSGAMTTSFSIQKTFGASLATTSWVLSAYALTLGTFIIILGRVGDIIGADKAFLAGLVVMSIFSLLSAIPQGSIIALLVFRAIQGLGAAAILPNGYAIAANYFKGKNLEKAIRYLVISVVGSLGLGGIIGGALSLTQIGGRSFFYFTFAVSTVGFVSFLLFRVPIEQNEAQQKMKIKNLDFPGMILLMAGLVLIIYGFLASTQSWKSPKVYVTLVVGVVMIIILCFLETYLLPKIKNACTSHDHYMNKLQEQARLWGANIEPIFPKEVFSIPNLVPLLLAISMVYLAFIATLNAIIDYQIYVEGDGPLMAAVKALPCCLGLCIGAILYREENTQKIGTRNLLLISGLLLFSGSIWIAQSNYRRPNDYFKTRFVSQIFISYGVNRYFMIYLNCVMAATPIEMQGLVSGIFNTFGQVFVALGSAVIATILGLIEVDPKNPDLKQKQFEKFHKAFYVSVAASILYIIGILFVKDPPKQERDAPDIEAQQN